MNVLIIDDQPDVVAGIHSGINWDALSIRQVFCANDIIRAREILSANSVDIMLCDIEMPLGSGLELYEWVAEHFPEIKCIFLTSHEDFAYAQKALQLGGFDYLIQPAPYSAIEASIQKAILQIKKERKEKFYSDYGNYFSKREMDLLNVLLSEFLQKQPAEPQNILSFLDTISIKLDPDRSCVLTLIDILEQDTPHPVRDLSLLRSILHNVIAELFEPLTKKLLFCHVHEQVFALILYEADDLTKDQVQTYLHTFLEAASQYLHFKTACYCAHSANFLLLPDKTQQLLEQRSENAADYSGIFYQKSSISQVPYTPPDFVLWNVMLSSGYYDAVRSDMHDYLLRQKEAGHVNQKMLSLFLQDFLQLFYQILNQHHIDAHGVFEKEYDIHALNNSCHSIEEMHKLLDFSVDYLKSLQTSAEPGVSQIDQVVDFIQKNIHQNITRTEIANQVYMNPEYLSRLFKKVKGISLSDYIVQEKLKIAISLLEGTSLPVSVIATNIGYTNFSYFTQVFKKVYGISPSEYRQNKK